MLVKDQIRQFKNNSSKQIVTSQELEGVLTGNPLNFVLLSICDIGEPERETDPEDETSKRPNELSVADELGGASQYVEVVTCMKLFIELVVDSD